MALFATGQMSLALQQDILTRYLKDGAGTITSPVVQPYVALATAVPTDNTFTEVTNANGYARVAIGFGAVTAGPPSYVQNTLVNFGAVTGSPWAAVVGYGIWDSGTYGGGNLLFYGALGTTLAFSACSVASPTVMTIATSTLVAGNTTVVNILTNGATFVDQTGSAAVGWLGPLQADVISTTSLGLPVKCTITGTGTVMVPTGTVTCAVGDVFQFAAGAISIFLD